MLCPWAVDDSAMVRTSTARHRMERRKSVKTRGTVFQLNDRKGGIGEAVEKCSIVSNPLNYLVFSFRTSSLSRRDVLTMV